MKTVFLDRDGTVIADPGYLSDPAGVVFEPSAVAALRRLHQAGFGLIFVSNQSGPSRGLMTAEQAGVVHQRVIDLLAAEGVPITGSYICPHAPWDHCACRKPSPGLLQKAAADHAIDFSRSFVVGNKKTDVDAGRATGCRAVLYATRTTQDNVGATPDFQSGNWQHIADWILTTDSAAAASGTIKRILEAP